MGQLQLVSVSAWNELCTVFVVVECIVSHTANCPDLPPLINGIIMYSAESSSNRPFSSSAVHSCNTGYTLTGGSTRTCVGGGSWNESSPTCQGEFCNSCTVCVFVSIYIR